MDEPKIRESIGKRLAGLRIRTSLADDGTSELWRSFRSRVPDVSGRVGEEAYSVRVYGPEYSFQSFDPAAQFDKWAAAEVVGDAVLPAGFEELTVPPGTYAVFVHRGTPARASETFGYIYGTWLPRSEFELDRRPHFEVLPEGWSPFDEAAEEEVWVPVRKKNASREMDK